jgi:myo-inositol-1-phosphate synthase
VTRIVGAVRVKDGRNDLPEHLDLRTARLQAYVQINRVGASEGIVMSEEESVRRENILHGFAKAVVLCAFPYH